MAPSPSDTTVDDLPTCVADVWQIDFKGDFDRRVEASVDELVESAFRLVLSLLKRLRSISRAVHLRPAKDDMAWSIEYFSDDGSRFEQEEGLLRGSAKLVVPLPERTWLAPETWQALSAHETAPALPASDELLLDALQMLPHIGAAIVLAATAIEVRIATALDLLASARPDVVAQGVWSFLVDRGDYRHNPSVEEKLSTLMGLLAGSSLKDNRSLWPVYAELRKARNTFAHEGRALLPGRVPVTLAKAHELVNGAASIVDWIEGFLPTEHRAPKIAFPTRRLTRSIPIMPSVTEE